MFIILKQEECFCDSQNVYYLPKRLLNLKNMICYNMCDNCYSNIKYNILSYTWDGMPTVNLDKLIIVPKWLSMKILNYKNVCKDIIWVWIDSICINQQDINDKKEQIPSMVRYYSFAKKVEIILDKFNCNNKLFKITHDYVEELIEMGIKTMDLEKKEEINKVIDYMLSEINLENQKWSTRIWTLQEILLGKEFRIIDNKHYLNLYELFKWLNKINEKWDSVIDHALSKRPTFSSIFQSWNIYNEKLYNNDNLSVIIVLQMSNNRSCTIEEDKVYGILGLLKNNSIPIEYNIGKKKALQLLLNYSISIGDTAWFSCFNNGFKNEWDVLSAISSEVGTSIESINDYGVICNLEEIGEIINVICIIPSPGKTGHKLLVHISKSIEKFYGYDNWEIYMLKLLNSENIIKDNDFLLDLLIYLKKWLLNYEDINQKTLKTETALNIIHFLLKKINGWKQKLTIVEIVLKDKTKHIKCVKGRVKKQQIIYQDIIKSDENMMATVANRLYNNVLIRTGIFMCIATKGINSNKYTVRFKT